MRYTHELFSAILFFVMATLILGGAFCVALPWAHSLQFAIADFIISRSDAVFSLGIGLLGTGLLCLVGFYCMYRKRYYRVKMDSPSSVTVIDMLLLRDLLDRYWREHQSQNCRLSDLFLHADQKLELIVEIPEMPLDAQEVLLEKLEQEVGRLLARQIGYQSQFFFTIVS